MASRRDLAAELLAKAADDEAVVRALIDDESVTESIVGFHAQQAVEKSLKAVLASRGCEFAPYGVRFRYGSAVAGDVARAEAARWADAALTWRAARSVKANPPRPPLRRGR